MRGTTETRTRIASLCGEPLEAAEFSFEVAAALHLALPFDGWCLIGLDPATGLRTFQLGGRGTERTVEMARNEALMDDVNKYGDLARGVFPAGWLSPRHPQARASFRLNEILVPQGFHSEIRLALCDRGQLWGALVLFREDPSRPLGDEDTLAVGAVADVLTAAVRAFPVRPVERRGSPPGGGVVALAPDDTLVAVSDEARAWLADLVPGGEDQTHDGDVTRVIFDAAHALRRGDPAGSITCVRTVSGHWMRVEATGLAVGAADVAVLLHSATTRQLLSTIGACHRLTAREVEVLGLLVEGRSGKQMARELGVSPLTVNDHLRSVYRKCGARGHDELLGRLT
jgi:DNA-binding CsgD family transcriptional regulator